MTKPNLAAGYHNTHGCCCCALLRRADYSPVSRQPHHRHPASEHRDHGRTAGTCGSTPRLQTSIKKQDPVRRKTAAMVRLLEQNLYCITSFINSHLCKVSAYNKMYACTPANISLRAYHDKSPLHNGAQRFLKLMHPRLSNSRKTRVSILMTPSVKLSFASIMFTI